jgi:hypothetical protein
MTTREVAETTKRKYEQAVERLNKAGLTLTDTDAVMKHLKDLAIGDSSFKVYLAAIRFKMGESTPKVYMDKMQELMGGIKQKEDMQKMSEKQSENYVPYKELVRVANELPMGVKKVLASLYTLTPPLRNNFGDMRVVNRMNSKTPGNLLVMNKRKATFIMRDYKTSGKFGTVKIPITQKAFAVVRDWFKHLGGQPEFLLGKEMSPTVVATQIEKAFKSTGKKVGVNALRHAYIIEHLPAIATDKLQKKNLADRMLHSEDRQLLYYQKQ